MNGQDFQFEEFEITESIGTSFHGFDFIICTLQGLHVLGHIAECVDIPLIIITIIETRARTTRRE
jgi:hypothetical protein